MWVIKWLIKWVVIIFSVIDSCWKNSFCSFVSAYFLFTKNLSVFIGLVLHNEYTTTNLLKELSCIQIVIEKSRKYFNLRALTNCQKTTFSFLVIMEKVVTKYADFKGYELY